MKWTSKDMFAFVNDLIRTVGGDAISECLPREAEEPEIPMDMVGYFLYTTILNNWSKYKDNETNIANVTVELDAGLQRLTEIVKLIRSKALSTLEGRNAFHEVLMAL